MVEYDTRSSDDVLWGIGLGCEGAMTILLPRLDPANDYQPYRVHRSVPARAPPSKIRDRLMQSA